MFSFLPFWRKGRDKPKKAQKSAQNTRAVVAGGPQLYGPRKHGIDRARLSHAALAVTEGLKKAGYQSFLVGGCVRDLLLGREPKDFDVVTDASPEQIKRVFRSARIIGRRFRLVHVRVGRDIIEVATFRALTEDGDAGRETTDAGRVLRDNVFGSQEDDARRRDFTVNALYYDTADHTIIDYVGGMADIDAGLIRIIGDARTRYREDPVRMLRAVRFAAKLGFKIEAAAEAPIAGLAHLVGDVPAARLYDEVLKLFHGGMALETFEMLRHYDLFEYLFPAAETALTEEDNHFPRMLIPRALENTDKRVNEDKPVTPAFLFAVMLWYPMVTERARLVAKGMPESEASNKAASRVVREQAGHTMIPKRFSLPMRELWDLQPRLARRAGKHAQQMLDHPRFRAAYDFLVLRAEVGDADQELADWWTEFQERDDAGQREMVRALAPDKSAKKKRRRRRRKKKSPSQPD